MKYEEIDYHTLKLQTMEWKGHWAVTPKDVYDYYKHINPEDKIDISRFFRGYVEYNKNALTDIEIYKLKMKSKKEEELALQREERKKYRELQKKLAEIEKLKRKPWLEPMPENTRPAVKAFVLKFLMDQDEE